MSTSYNLKKIMSSAHALARLVNQPGDYYPATLATALRIAWEEERENPARQWEAMTGEEQDSALWRMTVYSHKHDDANFKIVDGKKIPLPPVMAWVRDGRDLEEIKQEAWLRVYDRLQAGRDKTIKRCLSRAVRQAAIYLGRKVYRNPTAMATLTDDDGNEYNAELRNAAPTADYIPGPEESLILRDTIDRACRDEMDRQIVAGIEIGLNQQEIAGRLDVSQKTVSTRLAAIRERYAAM